MFKVTFILFISLLILWNIFFPAFEGADETGHFCSADYIAHRAQIPNLNIQDGCYIWHPPLYYLILSPFIKIYDLPELKISDLSLNPKIELLRRGEYAQYTHSKEDLFLSWNNYQLLNHILRVISSFFGVGIFLLAWKLSKIIFSNQNQRNLSLLLFFNPMFLHIFTTVTNVTLISFIASAFIAIEIIYAKKTKPYKIILIQGMLFGLGYLTKMSILGLGFAFIYLSFLRWKNFTSGNIKKLKGVLFFLFGFLAIAGWYILRSLRLYGEVIELNVLARQFGQQHHDLLLEKVGFLNYMNSFLVTIFKTFWSGYSALTIRFPEFINLILFTISTLLLYSIIVKRKKLRVELKICLYYVVSISISLFIMNLRLAAMHAKDLFTAYLPLTLLFSFGLFQLIKLVREQKISMPHRLMILMPIIYFFSQNEIIRTIKFIFQSFNLTGFFQIEKVRISQVLLNFTFKILLILLVYWIVIKILKNLLYNKINTLGVVISAFIVNLLILISAVYLLYKNFI